VRLDKQLVYGATSRKQSDDRRENQRIACRPIFRGVHASNETKMSDGGRERASLGVEVSKSSSKVERTAVRRSLHRMVELSRYAASVVLRLVPQQHRRAASWGHPISIVVHEKHQSFT